MSQQKAIDLSADEEAFGFTAVEMVTGVRAVVAQLPDGLRALRRRTGDGGIQYEVCDASLQPLYAPAGSVEELRRRFRRSSSA